MKKYLAAMLLLLLGMVACSDSGSEYKEIEHKQHNFFTFSVGSYWIFDAYDVDKNEDVILSTRRTDSLVIISGEKERDSLSYTAEFYKAGKLFLTTKFKTYDYDLYLWNFEIDKDFPIRDEWYKIVGYKYGGLWNLLSFTENTTIAADIKQFTLMSNGYFGEDSRKTFNGAEINTSSYQINRNKKYEIFAGGDTTKVIYSETYMNKTFFTFAEGIGLYGVYEMPYTKKIRESDSLRFEYFNGIKLELAGYGKN